MIEQEQIEEMANYYCEYCKKQTGEKFCEHIDDKSCNIFFEAELFYNAGYRKIPEDSIVLSREEYKRLLDNAIRVDMEYLDHELAKERKETAKEILEIMSNIICEMYGEDAPCNYNDIDEYMFNNCRDYCDKNCTNGHFANCWKMFLKAKIKEYGVEVENEKDKN